jgi:hypothetical protein
MNEYDKEIHESCIKFNNRNFSSSSALPINYNSLSFLFIFLLISTISYAHFFSNAAAATTSAFIIVGYHHPRVLIRKKEIIKLNSSVMKVFIDWNEAEINQSAQMCCFFPCKYYSYFVPHSPISTKLTNICSNGYIMNANHHVVSEWGWWAVEGKRKRKK